MASLKQCCTCKVHKELSAYTKDKSTKDGLKYRCRDCRKAMEHDPEKKALYNAQYWRDNKSKMAPKAKAYREEHADEIAEYQARYREANEDKIAKYRRAMAGYMKRYNEAYKPRKNEWVGEKRKRDPDFRVACNLRNRFHSYVKGAAKTFDALGMDVDTFRDWISFQFGDGMGWSNYSSTWELDHVLPVSRFDMSDPAQRRVCFHWTNFQPKAKACNRAKSNKIVPHEFFNCFISAHRFIQKRGLGCQEYQALRESVAWLRVTISGTVTTSWMTDGRQTTDRPKMGNPQPSS